MAYYKRILVCFDLSDTDEVLAQHVSNYCNENQVDKVYFLNVTNTLEIPDEIAEKYPDLLVPVDESIKKSMAYTIEKYFPERSSYEIDVAEGSRAEKILKWSKVKDTDLIVMGLKADRQGVDVLIRKIAKLAHSTLSLIPDQVPEKLNRILIPMDFSGHSKMALEEAIGLKTKNPWVEIRGLHIYTVPSGYHKTGKSYEEFAEIMKQNAFKEFESFLRKIDTQGQDVNFDAVLDDDNDPSGLIYKYANDHEFNLIIMGSKGRTAAASFILGSISEKIIALNKTIPMRIIKDKQESLSLLQAILKL